MVRPGDHWNTRLFQIAISKSKRYMQQIAIQGIAAEPATDTQRIFFSISDERKLNFCSAKFIVPVRANETSDQCLSVWNDSKSAEK